MTHTQKQQLAVLFNLFFTKLNNILKLE